MDGYALIHIAFLLPDITAPSPTLGRLMEACAARGHTVSRWAKDDVSWQATAEGFTFAYQGGPLPAADVVYWWLDHHDSSGQRLVEAMEMAGLPLFHSPFLPMSDKLSQARHLATARVPIPLTRVVTLETFSKLTIEWPQVLKRPHSARGEGVRWAATAAEVAALAAEVGIASGESFVLQQPVYPLGRDVRAFLLDGTLLAAMERHAAEGEFRTNIAAGGHGTATELNETEGAICKQAWQAMGKARWAGVDFIRSDDGPVVLEVNLWPGFLGLEAATGLPVAGKLVESMEAFAASHAA